MTSARRLALASTMGLATAAQFFGYRVIRVEGDL